MRLYTFVNLYLSDIQRGIQSLHVLGNMIAKYTDEDRSWAEEKMDMITDWAKNHKTVIVLNGGNQASLVQICGDIENSWIGPKLPHACFYEDGQSLNGCLTAVGIIVPEYIYETARMMRGIRGMYMSQVPTSITMGSEEKDCSLFTYMPKESDSNIASVRVNKSLDNRIIYRITATRKEQKGEDTQFVCNKPWEMELINILNSYPLA